MLKISIKLITITFLLNFNFTYAENETLESCFKFDSWAIQEYLLWNKNCWKDVIIPEYIKWISVEKLWDYSFSDKKIVSVFIPNSVVDIWEWAFSNNMINSVVIPDSVKNIWDSAFWNNNLSSLKIPDSVVKIWEYSFSKNNLTSIVIWDYVEEIWFSAFWKNGITSLELSKSIKYIWFKAFAKNNLKSVILPNSLEIVWVWVFDEGVIISRAEEEISEKIEDVSIKKEVPKKEKQSFLIKIKLFFKNIFNFFISFFKW